MEIRNVNVRISAVSLAVFAFFTILVIIAVAITGDPSILLWGIPTLVLLIIIPGTLNYMSQSQYAGLVPVYEKEAKDVRARAITTVMIGKPVRLHGTIKKVKFRYLNRPHYTVTDPSGDITVKMFTTPQEDVEVGDRVEVLGLVMKRYVISGDPVVNCVSIRRTKEE
ncbi:nucleotide-binding protein [uncultured Methanofollis sp.]|uniref:nucleotide-binding protein n=1 Tax=uncultured Methanofollis sp. TaxID=262500 RepID=UPI0026081757|nr:nucleotide-binding protein [uncultured Methanofollis sp.]